MDEPLTLAGLARTIDATLLRPEAVDADYARLCDEAARYGFAAVAVHSGRVPFCAARLRGSGVAVCAAVGFGWGQTPVAVKVYEAQQALAQGADEIDFVINYGELRSGRAGYVADEIAAVVQACAGHVSKVILETCYLNDAQKQAVVEMAIAAGATFVKTSTGLGSGGATMPDVLLMVSAACDKIKVKAAGGIRTFDQALGYLDAGCARIGTSQAAALMAEAAEVLQA